MTSGWAVFSAEEDDAQVEGPSRLIVSSCSMVCTADAEDDVGSVADAQFGQRRAVIVEEASALIAKAQPLLVFWHSKPLLQAQGRIEEITADTITLSHGPVPAIGWPAMTMTFKLDPPSLAGGLKAGDQAAFGFEQRPDGPAVRSLRRMEASR